MRLCLGLRFLAIGVAAALLSCSDYRPFVGRVSYSKYFEYHDEETGPLCPGLLDLIDRHAEIIGGKIGTPLDPGGNRWRYYKFPSAQAFATQQQDCDPGLEGCALANVVYSTEFLHEHELAHDYAYGAWGGWSVGLLNEGEAVALSCEPGPEDDPDLGAPSIPAVHAAGMDFSDWRPLLNLRGDSFQSNTEPGYFVAGVFVTYLSRQYGWDAVQQLYRYVAPGSTAADVEQAFARVFPTSIDAAWAAAINAPGGAGCIPDWLCADAAPLHVGETAGVACDSELHRSLQVQAVAGAVLAVQGGGSLLSCPVGGPPFVLNPNGEGTASPVSVHWVSLPPGMYAITRNAFAAPQAVTLQSYFQDPLVGPSCNAARAVSLSPSLTTHIDLPSGLIDGWLPVTAPSSVSYQVIPDGIVALSPASTMEACDQCGSLTSCTPLSSEQITTITIGPDTGLHFSGAYGSRMWNQITFSPAPAGK